MRYLLSLLAFTILAATAQAQAPEPLVLKVKTSIARGVESLVRQQQADGSWEAITEKDNQRYYHGGPTGLAILALLHCDGVIDNPKLEQERKQAIAKGLANLRKIDSPKVYVRALQTMAMAEAKSDIPLIKANVQWLLEARVYNKGRFIGWTYDNRTTNRSTDASNSQYAMLALWYARQAGVPIERKVWDEIQDYYARTQNRDGSWIYSAEYGPDDEQGPSMTMTVAGLCGLLIAGQELSVGQLHKCGVYDNATPLAKAQHWLNQKFAIDLERARTYYHLYGIERAGRLSGMRFFGEHDWYREGCEFIVKNQDSSGAWLSRGGWDRWPHVNTSFALLFLSKGRTPVVISKLVHGSWHRREDDTDWNNNRNDLRHLTEYVGKTDLFGKKPLAWQTYDIMRALFARSANPNINDENAIVADMRQSPILYITGHDSPLFRIQGQETSLIKRYIENGGFIFAEACCGDPNFDKGFKQWVKATWDQDLEYLSSTHPIWTSFVEVKADRKLMGLNVGCRTVMIYSPQELSRHWEANRQNDGPTELAFRLGANIIAYGTGRVRPQPRLTPIELASVETPMREPTKRGYFRVAQVKFRNDEQWQPAPKAMLHVMKHVNQVAGLDVKLRPNPIGPKDKLDLMRAKFFYIHGKGEIRAEKFELDALRFSLENGGLLFVDAACGDAEFDKSFRQFVQALFPKEKLTRLSTDPQTRDRFFGSELTASNIKCRTKANGEMLNMEPFLEGIRVNGRWVVLYSKYDIGCALERNTSSDCVGYDHDSAMRLAAAAVLYNARP